MRLKYTLGFVYCAETSQVLLLNRQKKPWMGRWNGVGGKLDVEESPLDCIVRETLEETGLEVLLFQSRGVLLWNLEEESAITGTGDLNDGIYLFTANVSQDTVNAFTTPRYSPCGEGILDWKAIDWVLSKDNLGITSNLKYILPTLFEGSEGDVYKTQYEGLEVSHFEYQKA